MTSNILGVEPVLPQSPETIAESVHGWLVPEGFIRSFIPSALMNIGSLIASVPAEESIM